MLKNILFDFNQFRIETSQTHLRRIQTGFQAKMWCKGNVEKYHFQFQPLFMQKHLEHTYGEYKQVFKWKCDAKVMLNNIIFDFNHVPTETSYKQQQGGIWTTWINNSKWKQTNSFVFLTFFARYLSDEEQGSPRFQRYHRDRHEYRFLFSF